MLMSADCKGAGPWESGCCAPHSHLAPQWEASAYLYPHLFWATWQLCHSWPQAPERRPRGERDVSPESREACRPQCQPSRPPAQVLCPAGCRRSPGAVPITCGLPSLPNFMAAAGVQKRMQSPHLGFTEEISPWHQGQGREKTADGHSQGCRGSEVTGPRWAQVGRQERSSPSGSQTSKDEKDVAC